MEVPETAEWKDRGQSPYPGKEASSFGLPPGSLQNRQPSEWWSSDELNPDLTLPQPKTTDPCWFPVARQVSHAGLFPLPKESSDLPVDVFSIYFHYLEGVLQVASVQRPNREKEPGDGNGSATSVGRV